MRVRSGPPLRPRRGPLAPTQLSVLGLRWLKARRQCPTDGAGLGAPRPRRAPANPPALAEMRVACGFAELPGHCGARDLWIAGVGPALRP